MMSDGQYRVDPDEVENAVGRLTADAIDVYKLSGDVGNLPQPNFSKAGAEIADAFAYVQQRLAESLRDTAQQMHETNMTLSQGMREYRRYDEESSSDFKNAGGMPA